MREYEIVFIVHPDLDEASFLETIGKVKAWITEAKGSVTREEVWGKKRLAYMIRKQREGQYVFLRAQLFPTSLTGLEHSFRITEPIMRYLITAVDE